MILSVMIVEDEEWVRKGLIKKVQRVAPEMKIAGEAADGLDALKILGRTRPDILITDIRLPVMDGIELIREAKGAHPLLKIVIVSGYAEFALAQQAIALGVSGYIIKPVVESDLAAVLAKIAQEIACASGNADASALPLNTLSRLHECIAGGRPDALSGIVEESFSEKRIDPDNMLHIEFTLKQLVKCIDQALLDAGYAPAGAAELAQRILRQIPAVGRDHRELLSHIQAELYHYMEKTVSESYVMKNMIAGIVQYVGRNYRGEITLEYFADKYKVDMSYLSRQFKRINGINLSEYVTNTRLEAAKSLLLDTRLSISEIAESVGFHDISYFHRVFKKRMQVTPAQFREDNRSTNKS